MISGAQTYPYPPKDTVNSDAGRGRASPADP
jgi:hypothetical protein